MSPSALEFSFLQGGSTVQSQPVFLKNGTRLSANFAVSKSGQTSLSVSPASGTVPAFTTATITVTVTATGLAPGTYTGTVNIAVQGGPSFSPVTITFTVSSARQALALSQSALLFQLAAASGPPPAQSIVVLNQGTGSLNWTAKASTLVGNWLSVAPSAGASGDSAAVSVDPANLQPGDYYGLVQFAAPATVNSPQSVVVVLNVLPATAAEITVEPTGLIFVAPQGGASPLPQTVTVANSSNQSVSVTATPVSPQPGLFSTNLTSGTVSSVSPEQFMITPNLTGLKAGVYRGTIEFQFGDGSTREVAILLIVTSPASTAELRTIHIHNDAASTSCTPTQLLPVSTALGNSFNSTAAWPTSLEVQVVDDCGSPMGPGDVVAEFSSGDPSLPLAALGAGHWAATWQPRYTSASTPVVITVTAQSAQPALRGTELISGTLQPNPTTPVIFSKGVVSTASFAPNAPLAPGAFASIFGKHLAASTLLAGALPLTTLLAGAQAIVAGQLIPVQYSSDGQLNVLIPYDIPPNSTQQLIVQQGLAYSTPETVIIAPAQPAVFTQNGRGAIVVVKPNGTQFNSDPSHPASAGDALVIYSAGLGAVTPPVETGSTSPQSPPAKLSNPITVTIGGRPAPVAFAGLTPNFAGLYQVNVTVPAGITPSANVPVVLTEGGLSSPPVTIAIK